MNVAGDTIVNSCYIFIPLVTWRLLFMIAIFSSISCFFLFPDSAHNCSCTVYM